MYKKGGQGGEIGRKVVCTHDEAWREENWGRGGGEGDSRQGDRRHLTVAARSRRHAARGKAKRSSRPPPALLATCESMDQGEEGEEESGGEVVCAAHVNRLGGAASTGSRGPQGYEDGRQSRP